MRCSDGKRAICSVDPRISSFFVGNEDAPDHLPLSAKVVVCIQCDTREVAASSHKIGGVRRVFAISVSIRDLAVELARCGVSIGD